MARQLILVTVMFRIAALALGQPTDTNTITTTTKSSPVITKFVTSYIDPTRRHCLEEVYRFWLKVPLDDKLKALVKDVRLHYEDTKTTVVDNGVSKSALKSCKTLHHTLTEEFRVKVPCWFDAREGLGLDETRTLMDVVHKIAKTKEARQHIKYVHEAHYAYWRKEVEISESRQQCLEKAIKFWKSLRPLTIDEHIKVLVRDARKNYRLLYLVGDEKRDESDSCKKLRAEAETSSKETVSCLYNRQIVGDPRKAWYDMLEQSIEVRLVKEALFVCDLDGATETDEVKLYYDAVKPYELDELEKLY